MNRFELIKLGCPKQSCGLSHNTDFYVVDKTTGKLIVKCMDEKTAQMVCLALNYSQNEGILEC